MEKLFNNSLKGLVVFYGVRHLLLLGIFVSGFFCVAFVPPQVNAACVVDITGAIICTGTDTTGVHTGDTGDVITVEPAATVSQTVQQTVATTASADTITIDAGNGLNTVTNLGNITSTAGATAQPAAGTASTATADATAVQTGDNADVISNVSAILSTASSSATSPDISLTATRAVFAPNATESTATATGIDGGGGQNQITNALLSGSITANATSNSTAPVVNIQVQDSAWAYVAVTADSEAIGIRGEGSISSFGTVNATAASGANSGAARATVAGSATADVFTRAQANATGIAASTNNDTIVSGFILSASSTATAEGSINLEGSATNVDIDASIRAEAATIGIDGKAGDDSITTSLIVTATSTANATSDSSGSSYWAPGVTDASTSSVAQTTGVAGGDGNDTITNNGILTATGQATTEVSNLLTSYGIASAAETQAQGGAGSSATVLGIDGGNGADGVTNNGVINSTATADTSSAGILLTYFGYGVFSVPTTATAHSTGIEGGGGDDTITNAGQITANATATASVTSVSVSGLQYDIVSDGDSSITATATGTAISGGTGTDNLTNEGSLTVSGTATASATRVGVEAAGSSHLVADILADATSVGIDGGDGNDTITNAASGLMTVNATSSASSVGVDAKMVGIPTMLYEFFSGEELDSARTATQATATGVSGGEGNDTITNSGTIVVGASADSDSQTWTITVTPPLSASVGLAGAILGAGATAGEIVGTGSSSSNDAVIKEGTEAEATAAGLSGGSGSDTITNNGSITASATADAYSVGVTVSLGFGTGGVMGIIPSVALVDAKTTADSTATGIDGGAGDDTINQNNVLTVNSNAYATSVGVGVDFKGSFGGGFAWGGTISDTSTSATAGATGISGGEGNDTITNSGTQGINVTSGADADAAAVSLTVMWANQGFAGGVTYVDDSTTSTATSVGIDGGLGLDTITNGAGLTVTAVAESTSGVVSVSAAGTETGVSLNAALADASLTATSSATGIAVGGGNDHVTNTDTMTVSSSADIDSGSVSVGLGFAETGITAGVAAADISVAANSTAIGINGGSGDDTLTNSKSMTTTSTSTISAAGVSVEAGYAINGVAVGAALAKGDSVATTVATGIEGGTGDDTLTNSGINTVSATSDVTAASVGVDLEGTSAGLAAGASAVDGNNTVYATATGLKGGPGNDKIYNYNQTTVSAVTDSTRTDVSVTGTFALEGIAAGAAFAYASNTATATAAGIDGGDGDETIVNNANLQADATTTAATTSVSIDINVSVEGVISAGAAVAEASTTGNAYSVGIAAGAGNDTIENQSSGVISGTATATAEVAGISITISTLGFSSADVSTNADADFTGIAGDAGNDTVHNYGTINIGSVSTATGESGTGTLLGYSSANVSITGTSTSIGMDGGDGNDTVANHHAIDVTSTATSTGVSVTVDLLGAGFANASTTANTYATGLAGGAGNDTLDNGGTITLTATSDVDQTGVAVVLGGYSDSDGSNTSQATITGMDGGAGDDTMTSYTGSTITGTATAKGEVVNVPISLLGDSNADGTTTATANAYGMAGGAGTDTMHNFGTITITADSTPGGTAGGATIGGYGEADVSITGTSTSIGMDGGDGNDTVANHHAIDVTSTATSTGVSVTVDLLGAGFANASTTANTYATGLAGGAGNDTLDNGGTITLTATSDVDQTGVAVVLGGYSDSDGSNTSQATITGMDGGAGDDTMTSYTGSTITGTATAKGEVVNVPISLLGDSNADGTTTATANAYGMAGGAGTDTMHNFGTITITADSTPGGTAGGATIGGYGEADVSITGTSTSIGMDGGDGNDTVANHHAIDVTSTATSTGVSVTVDLLGAGFANASTTANTYATGLAGGAGNDTIDNAGSITLTSTSDVDQTGVAVVLGGYSDSDGSNTSQATITGMDGGAGDDTMTSYTGSTITGTATAKGEVVNVPISLLGDSNADGTITATANAYGMAGGAGTDTMHNYGTITITADSTPTGQAGSGTLAGYGEADVNVTGTSTSVGMDGGDGNDTVANHHAVNVKSTVTSKGVSVTVDFFGAGFADASTSANSYATGLAGRAGNDTIDNGGSIHLIAASKVNQTGVSATLGGEASSNGSNTALATLVGMDGGEGDDVLTNYTSGQITIVDDEVTHDHTASVYMSSVTVELAGDQQADGTSTATANAYGMAGGAGNDTIRNAGDITVNISSYISAAPTSAQLFGNGTANTSGTSNTTVVGMDGGDGDNTMTNYLTGTITLTATASGKASSYSLELGGAGHATAGTGANAYGYGMRAGSSGDYLYNYGTVDVTAASTLTDSSSAYTLFGSATASSNDSATSTAVGMDAGNGINTVLNDIGAHLTVDATASASAENGTKTFGGTAEADANSTASATAKGLTGGTARDIITNNGNVDTDAYATAKAVTNAALFAGHATANSTTSMTVRAFGIDAGDGQNQVVNSGSITTDAIAENSIYSKADTDFTATTSNAQSTSDVAAFGIRTGSGDSSITNGQSGTMVVHSYARNLSFTVAGEGAAIANSTAVSDEHALASAIFTSSATGFQSGDGNNTITNSGTLTVTAETTPDAHAQASSTEQYAEAIAKAGGTATATGIKAGTGINTITNNGPLTVTATNTANALADYTSTHLDHAVAYAGAGDVSLTSNASGISVGNGTNTIESRGDMTVTSTLTSYAHGHSNTDWADNRGDAYAGGTATAAGISAGDGQNTVRNYGSMTVTATAGVAAYGDGEDAATARATSEANAVGITTGNGNNTVANYGTINVTANRSAYAFVSVGSDASATESASAVGIQTGSGNDLVTNLGTITTTENIDVLFWRVFDKSGIAITTGAGNDTVVLGAGSATTGTIDLGTGDDTLKFLGTATINGDILPGTGSNSLIFEGTGSLGYDFSGFENTTKQGAGTFTLASLPTMRNLSINQGTLHINNSYAMAGNSAFSTYVNGNNGGAGLLSVNGAVSLAGAMTVAKGPGYFYNGSVYDIITGNSVSGTFSGVMLPQSTPLLSFSMLQSSTAVQITTHTRSFTTFASNPVEWAVADYLDRIQHTSSNDLLAVLAEIQNLPASQLGQAFSSLGPQTYDASTRASYFGSWQSTGSLQRRMGNVRSYGSSGSGSKPLLLAFAGSDAAIDRLFTPGELSQTQKKSGLWLNGYQQWGDQQGTSGFTGYDYGLHGGTLGFDHTFSNNLMAGVSFGHSRTSVDLDDHWGKGDIKNTTGSFYGSYFTGNAYIEGALSYGRNKYSNYRNLTIGSINRRADSDHYGDVYSAYLGGGYLFDVNKWIIGPFGSLKYVYLNEDGFTETGADSLSLRVDRRKTDSLVSELGLRVARQFRTNSGSLIPELTAALNYDFDIDDRVITASFSGSPDATFSVKGQKVERYGATVGVGLIFIHDKGFSTTLKYSGEFREKYQSHGVMGQLRFSF